MKLLRAVSRPQVVARLSLRACDTATSAASEIDFETYPSPTAALHHWRSLRAVARASSTSQGATAGAERGKERNRTRTCAMDRWSACCDHELR